MGFEPRGSEIASFDQLSDGRGLLQRWAEPLQADIQVLMNQLVLCSGAACPCRSALIWRVFLARWRRRRSISGSWRVLHVSVTELSAARKTAAINYSVFSLAAQTDRSHRRRPASPRTTPPVFHAADPGWTPAIPLGSGHATPRRVTLRHARSRFSSRNQPERSSLQFVSLTL